MHIRTRIIICLLLVISIATVVAAQLGVVTDGSGSAIAGAMVQLANAATGFSRTEVTGKDGRYQSRNLPLGNYTVTVQQAGFRTEERSGITLSVASQVAVNVQMSVGSALHCAERNPYSV